MKPRRAPGRARDGRAERVRGERAGGDDPVAILWKRRDFRGLHGDLRHGGRRQDRRLGAGDVPQRWMERLRLRDRRGVIARDDPARAPRLGERRQCHHPAAHARDACRAARRVPRPARRARVRLHPGAALGRVGRAAHVPLHVRAPASRARYRSAARARGVTFTSAPPAPFLAATSTRSSASATS